MSELINQLVKLLQQPSVLERDDGQAPLALIPQTMNVVDLEKFDAHPSRIRQTIELTNISKFVQLVNRFKNDHSIVFITPDLKSLGNGGTLATAVIDYNRTGQPEWGTNRISLEARPSLAYEKLMDLDNELLDQSDFAKALEDIARFVHTHAQADLLEIAQTMRLTSKGEFKNYDDDVSGSIDIRYDLQVQASAGTAERKLNVPTEIGFKIPLIDGLPEVVVPVKLLYRAPAQQGQKVKLGIKIIDRTWLEDAAISAVTERVETETGLEAYPGEFTLGAK